MGAAYPELVRAEPLIVETLLLEETRFKHLLERGLHPAGRGTRRLGEGGVLPARSRSGCTTPTASRST